jgi:hypothetical protein
MNSSLTQLESQGVSVAATNPLASLCQRQRMLGAVDVWLTVFVLLSLFLFALLYAWRPTALQYTGPDKRPTGVVNTLTALVAAMLLAALTASVIVAFQIMARS